MRKTLTLCYDKTQVMQLDGAWLTFYDVVDGALLHHTLIESYLNKLDKNPNHTGRKSPQVLTTLLDTK